MSIMTKIMPMVFACISAAVAAEKEAEPCAVISNYKQLILCAETRSPEVLKAEAEVHQKKASVEAATQLLNPELSVQTLSGSTQSESRSETDVALAFPIELGGKRSSRKGVATGAITRAELELFSAKADLRKMISLNLVRLRQIDQELELVDESADTFSKLVKQYEARPKLSPEQEITLTVFRIAKGDYSFKRMEYDEEISQLQVFFQIATGKDLASIRKVLPPQISALPAVPSENEEIEKSPLIGLLNTDLVIAKAERDRAAGDAWPTLNIGPSAKFTKEGNQSFEQWGVNLSMPLPILSLNRGAKAAANAEVQTTEIRREAVLRELKARRASLVEVYKKSAKALKETPNGQSLEDKHKKVETLFVKGLVPSSLVIEAHRSLVDFEKTRNNRELKAIEAILEIQIIDGHEVEINL